MSEAAAMAAEHETEKQVSYRHSSHCKYLLKTHMVWATKYRYKVLTNPIKARLSVIISQACKEQNIIVESGHIAADHIHLFLSYPPSMSIAQIAKILKGRTSRIIMQENKEAMKVYWGNSMWSRGYFASSVNGADGHVAEYLAAHEGKD
jgi:putative transposase